MNDGAIDGRQVFPANDIRALATMQSRVPVSPCGYSYGLSICTDPVTRLSHYGFRVGSGAVFTLVPERCIAVIILANRNGGIFGRTERVVLEQLGVPQPRGGAPDAPPTRMGARERARFAGAYANGPDTLHLIARGDSLLYRYGTNEQRTAAGGADEIYLLGSAGAPVQSFRLVRGATSRALYLHDGLSAFAKIERRRR